MMGEIFLGKCRGVAYIGVAEQVVPGTNGMDCTRYREHAMYQVRETWIVPGTWSM
jgi:hypothetical protein